MIAASIFGVSTLAILLALHGAFQEFGIAVLWWAAPALGAVGAVDRLMRWVGKRNEERWYRRML